MRAGHQDLAAPPRRNASAVRRLSAMMVSAGLAQSALGNTELWQIHTELWQIHR